MRLFTWISLCLIGVVCLTETAKGQSGDDVITSYNRVGITPVLLNNQNTNISFSPDSSFKSIEVPSKFDNNKIGNIKVNAPLPSIELPEDEEGEEEQDESVGGYITNRITQELSSEIVNRASSELGGTAADSIVRNRFNNQELTQEVIDSMYDKDAEGRYSMDDLFERAKYNLTDDEITRLKSSAKGFEQGAKDYKWAEKILQSNYVLGFMYHDMKKVNINISGNNDEDEEEEDEGFSGSYQVLVTAFLYKIDFNDSLQAVFYNNAWAGPNSSDETLKAAKEARKNINFPLEKVGNYHYQVNVSPNLIGDEEEEKSEKEYRQEALRKVPQKSLKKAIDQIEKDVPQFKVRTSIYDYNQFPTSFAWAKIGTKEGLIGDQRFYVYELVADENGEIKKKRKGVLRSTTDIADNDTAAAVETDPSKFLQTAGWGLGKGMLLEENPDVGMAIGMGYMNQGNGYFNTRIELRFSSFAGLSPSWHLYGDIAAETNQLGGFDKEEIDLVSGQETSTLETDANIVSYGVGFSKEFYFLKWFHLAPYAGVRREDASFNDTLDDYLKENLDENYGEKIWTFDAGARLGFNITHWLKLRGTIGFSPISYDSDETIFGEEVNSDMADLTPEYEEGDENPFYLRRKNIKWDIMLRVNF